MISVGEEAANQDAVEAGTRKDEVKNESCFFLKGEKDPKTSHWGVPLQVKGKRPPKNKDVTVSQEGNKSRAIEWKKTGRRKTENPHGPSG